MWKKSQSIFFQGQIISQKGILKKDTDSGIKDAGKSKFYRINEFKNLRKIR